ncbi:MAG: histidine kinase [Rubripirellula sp.]
MSTETSNRILMVSGDLVFGSRVKAAAERADWKFSLGGRLPDGELDDVRYVIVDLSTRSGVVGTIVGECNERCPSAKLIAYGPHVQVPKLKAARDAGIEQVITNSQFDAMLATLFD